MVNFTCYCSVKHLSNRSQPTLFCRIMPVIFPKLQSIYNIISPVQKSFSLLRHRPIRCKELIKSLHRINTKSYRPIAYDGPSYNSNFDTVGVNIQSSGKDNDYISKHEESNSTHFSLKRVTSQQEQLLVSKLEELMNNNTEVTNEDWHALRNSFLDNEICITITEENIDAVILNKCTGLLSLSLGKSYFKYLKSTQRKINLAIFGNYFLLFYNCSPQCTKEDFNEIYTIYHDMLKVFPVIDCYTAEKAICALSITEYWREYEKLFDIIKQFYHPCTSIYSVVIQTAFANKEFELGWTLMEEMQSYRLNTPDEVFCYWLEEVKHRKTDEALIRMFNFLNKFDIKPSLMLSEIIQQIFMKSDKNRKGIFTSVSKRGECLNCRAKLEAAKVPQDEFEQLKNAFLNPVLLGKDIFLKTRPEEFSKFLKFLELNTPVDVVLDGLNVAMKIHKSMKSSTVFALQLKCVVQHFVEQGKKVLVIGRKHMSDWPLRIMSYVHDNAAVFLAEDISQDDPFLLYATLYSGLGTRFVSRDMMRSHKFLLSNPKLQNIFEKWQEQHQCFILYIEENGIVNIQEPVTFMQRIQQNERKDWHIPYLLRENLTTHTKVDNFHKHWLCLVNNATKHPLNSPNKKVQYGFKTKYEVHREMPPSYRGNHKLGK